MQQLRWLDCFEETTPRSLAPTHRAAPESKHFSRWFCLSIANFSLEVICPQADQTATPVVVVDENLKDKITCCNTPAKEQGLYPGMGLSAAYGLVNELIVKKRSEAEEVKALHILAAWAMRYTSVVCLFPPNALVLEIKGSERLFGGARRLSALIREQFVAFGYNAAYAVAPTALAAWLLARATELGEFSQVNAGNLMGALSKVDIDDCDFDKKTIHDLHSVGLRKLSDCYRLPRDALARRVGPSVVDFLDRASGKTTDPRLSFEMPRRFERCISMPSPTQTVDFLLLASEKMLLELTPVLQALSAATSKLVFRFFYQKQKPSEVIIYLLTPSRDVQHIQRLFRERLERLSLSQPVERMSLEVDEFTNLAPGSLDFFLSPQSADESWYRLSERLRARLGDKALYGLSLLEEHRPEKAWGIRTPGEMFQQRRVANANRPLWLLPQPVPIQTRQGVPTIRGKLTFATCYERIESGWWDGADVARDYFEARNSRGERFWIFRDCRAKNRWYVHGVFA